MEFEKKINLGHLLVALGMMASAIIYSASVKSDIAKAAIEGQYGDRELQYSQEITAANLRRVTDTLDELVRWRAAHEQEWAVHKSQADR
jgi:hypothetical protein